MDSSAETSVALLTPAATGAIATLAIRGPRAWEVVRALVRRVGKSRSPLPEAPEAGSFWLGRFGPEPAEEVVVACKQFEPFPWIELHGHGGMEVIRYLQKQLQAHGVAVRSWSEWDKAHLPPLHSAATEARARARTVRTASILLDQFHGALERALDEVGHELSLGNTERACALLDRLLRHADLGRHLTVPWKVVVAGAPNVGKSSLVNALAGYTRCVVSPTPGTTRDVVTTVLAVDGWPVELTDTAGQRGNAEHLEAEGIARAVAAAEAADLCLWVLDAASPPVWPTASLPSMRFVINKIDLPGDWDLSQTTAIPVSAQTGAGLHELCAALSTWLVPAPPTPGEAVPFTAEVVDQLTSARACLAEGKVEEGRRVLAWIIGGTIR